MSKQKTFVTIHNPVEGGSRYTSYERALDYVNRGMAEWCAHLTIQFVEREKRKERQSDDWMGKPRISLATVLALRNTPVINPMALLTNPSRRKVMGGGSESSSVHAGAR
jgi:hypothetical protein